MSETTAKGFKVPKIKRQESKDNLRTVELKSRDAQEISNLVSRSYLERNYKSPWELKALHLVDNKELEDSYRVKKVEMKDDGRHARDLADQYAFLMFRDSSMMAKVIKQGLVARPMPFNALGASKFGVYLCRNADVQLRLAEGKGLTNCTLVVFKITLGKCKTLAQQSMTEGENIEPTPNYDCHIPQVQAKPSDSLYLQLARSQVYLYEYTDECIPSERPRQCLPYAILSYEKQGAGETTSESTSGYGKQTVTSTSSTTKTEQTPADQATKMKRTVSYSDTTEKTFTSSMGQRSRSDPNFIQQQSVETPVGTPLQANIIRTEPRPRDPRLARMGDARVNPADPRNRPGDPRLNPVDPRLNKGGPRFSSEPKPNQNDSRRYPGDPRTLTRPTDPRSNIISGSIRSNQTDNKIGQGPPVGITGIPLPNLNDPRLNPIDPRFSEPSLNFSDPRNKPSNQPNIPTDPRMNPSDPRINAFSQNIGQMHGRSLVDPRLRGNPNINVQSQNVQSSIGHPASPDPTSYEPSFGPPAGGLQKNNFSTDPREQNSLISHLPAKSFTQRDLPRDPRLRNKLISQEQSQEIASPIKSNSDSRLLDPNSARKKLSIHEYKKKVEVLVKTDDRYKQFDQIPTTSESVFEGVDETEHFENDLVRQSPMKDSLSGIRDVTISPPYSPSYNEPSDQNEYDSAHDDIVTSPYMMMQTLSALSEPDDVSMSPKETEGESDSFQVDEVDSALTVAIRKLVEHSSDMAVLTQAVQVLGQTHDMKDILEALKKAMISSIKPDAEKSTEKSETPADFTAEVIKKPESPIMKATGKTLPQIKNDDEEKEEKRAGEEAKTMTDKISSLTENATEIPLPDSSYLRDTPLKDKQVPKVDKGVKFFLDEYEEKSSNTEIISEKGVLQKTSMKDLPSIGYSPHKSLLSKDLDKDDLKKTTKTLFQSDTDERKRAMENKLLTDQYQPSVDKDERKICMSPILSQSESAVVEDIDERRHHSRSASPKQGVVPQDIDERNSHSRSLSPVISTKIVSSIKDDTDERSLSPMIPGLSKSGILDVDERRSRSRSHSPVISQSAPAMIKRERNYPTPIMSPDPESGDSLKDDLLNRNNNSISDPAVEDKSLDIDLRQSRSENEFGDVDWRWTAATEMGDVDLRAKPGQAQAGDYGLPPVFEAMNDFWDKREKKDSDTVLRETFGCNKVDYPHSKPYESYSTSDSKYESYETSKNKIPSYSTAGNVYGEYSSSNKADVTHLNVSSGSNYPAVQPPMFYPQNPNFIPPPQQAAHPQQPDMMNFNSLLGSVNLDFANLKNILATVQKPSDDKSKPARLPGEGVVEEEEVTSNLPAFVTGLCTESPKKDTSLSKYSGKPREWVPGRKPFFPKEELPEKPVPNDPNYDPTRAPELQKPKTEIKYERNFEPQTHKPKTEVKYDRNFEPVLQKPKIEVKYDRNFEPLNSQKQTIKQEQNLPAEAVQVAHESVCLSGSDKTEKDKKELISISTSSEIKTDLDKNEPVSTSASDEIDKVKNEPVSISVSSKTEKVKTESDHISSSDKMEKVENKPVSVSVSAEKELNWNKSTIQQGEVRHSDERTKKEIKYSDTAKQKESSGTDPPKKHLIFSIGDMVKQVRETSCKDPKTAKITEENINKGADKPITSVKDKKKPKSPEENVNKRVDKPMIFSIGDMVKRVRETSVKKDVRKAKCDEDNTNNGAEKKRKKSSLRKVDSENEKLEEKDRKDPNILSNMTPYQKAIMESLETSDLRIRHDESIVSEIDESPQGEKHNKTCGKQVESKMNTEKSKKSRFSDYKKTELDDVSDTSDDERFGLVIDLGETPAKKSAEHVKDAERHLSGLKSEETTEENPESLEGGDDCLMVEMETEKPEVVDLTEDDHDMGTFDTPMKRGTEHEMEEDVTSLPLLKKIKVEKLAEDLEKERRLAEEAKLAEAFGVDKSDSELDMDEHTAAQGDRMKKVIGQQPRKKIVINLKSTGRKSKNKTEETNVNNGKTVAENKTDKEKAATNDHDVSKTDKSKTDKANLEENRQEKVGTESGPIRTVQRLGQRNLTEPRAVSPITVLGMASHRTPSPLTVQKINSDIQPSSISSAIVQRPVPLDTVSPVSQPWSKHEQQHSIQSVHSNQYGENRQAVPDLSQISSIPPPIYRSPSPVNQMVSLMSSLGAAGFRSTSPVNALGSAFIASTMQNLQSMIASNMGSGVTVPMPPVGSMPPVRPIATLGCPPFQPLTAPPNLAVPPPNLNIPPPNISHQPLSQRMGPLPYPVQPDTRLGNLVQVTQDPLGPFPQIHGSFTGPPGSNMSNLPGPQLSSSGLMPTMQGNLTIPVIGQTQQNPKEAMLQDVLQRARQRAAEIGQTSAPQSEGMPIQTIGQSSSSAIPKHTSTNLKPVETTDVEDKAEPKSKDDVLDWFSDKFDIKKDPKYHSTPVRQMEEPMHKYPGTPDSSSESGRKRAWEYETDDYGKKLRMAPDAESQAEHYYESNLDPEQSDVVNVLQQHSVENLNKAKDVILKSLASLPPESSDVGEMKSEHGMESSDLEEGELSEDSSVTGSPLITEPDNRRVVIQNKVGNNIQVMCAANNIQRIQTIGADKPSSPKRVVRAVDQPVTTQSKGHHHKNLAAVDWADMLQRSSHDKDPRERRLSAFQRLDSSDSRSVSHQKSSVSVDEKDRHHDNSDGAGILASSAALLTKTKQKLMARGQVKTLGDWLKLELEIENIQPLQKYIPYAFNTDLTAIPKGRRRKIKGKVRTVLEKEGKASGLIQQAIADQSNTQPTVSVTSESKPTLEQTKPVHCGPPINPIYTPEVPNSQIQCELELVKKTVSGLRDRSGDRRGSRPGYHNDARGKMYVTLNSVKTLVEPGSEAESQVMSALQTVETEMVTMLQRTYFYGYPHRRVPKDLLLESELYSFKSPHQDIFLILMMPLSIKPYNKLLAMKKEIEALLKHKNSEEGEKELKNLHVQREGVIRSFTGYLNKKRVTKLQDLVNKYTLAYDFFKGQPRPPADSALKFIRTTQIDLRQHLLLAKQYLAMDEKKAGSGS